MVVIEEAINGPSLKPAGGVEGLDGSEPASWVDADFADPRVGGVEGMREGAFHRGAGDAGFDLREEAPCAVEEEDGEACVGGRQDGCIDAQEDVAGGVELEAGTGGFKAQVGAAPKRLEAALGLTFLWMPYDDILKRFI